MTINIDYKKHDKCDLLPKLEMFLNDLAIRKPNVKFVVSGTRNNNGERRVRSVDVYDGYEKVGAICIEMDYNRTNSGFSDKDSFDIYEVTSPKIVKSRGSADTRATKHYKKALKLANDLFEKSPADVLANQIHTRVAEAMQSMGRTAENQFEHSFYSPLAQIGMYLHKVKQEGPQPFPTEIEPKFNKEWMQRADDYRIAHSLLDRFEKHKDGVAIRIEIDGTINVVDVATVSMLYEAKSTYDLPNNYQEKITIAKILEHRQPVEHIGVRFDDGSHDHPERAYFYLVGGDTFTDC
jgi:prolyl oligopeptidase PreP (S9A serine peptidase family)